MNPRTSGVISKKFTNGTAKTNAQGNWYRIDAVVIAGKKYSYFSNPPKSNPSAEAIEDRYPECKEGMAVDVEYAVNGDYFNVKDMSPSGSTLPASDPVAKMTAPRVPDHLQAPAHEIAQPLADLNPNGTAQMPTFPVRPDLTRHPVAAAQGEPKDWQIARSVAIKDCNAAATGGYLPALCEAWGVKQRSAGDVEIKALASLMAAFIVTGE